MRNKRDAHTLEAFHEFQQLSVNLKITIAEEFYLIFYLNWKRIILKWKLIMRKTFQWVCGYFQKSECLCIVKKILIKCLIKITNLEDTLQVTPQWRFYTISALLICLNKILSASNGWAEIKNLNKLKCDNFLTVISYGLRITNRWITA